VGCNKNKCPDWSGWSENGCKKYKDVDNCKIKEVEFKAVEGREEVREKKRKRQSNY
jgi:hypothetical protein